MRSEACTALFESPVSTAIVCRLALAFYRDKLGLKVVTDQPFNETQRLIELRIGGAETGVVPFNTDDGVKSGSFSANRPATM